MIQVRSQIALRRDGAAGRGVGGSGASAEPGAARRARAHVEFLSRYDFHLTAEHLSGDDPRFVWDAELRRRARRRRLRRRTR